MKINEVKGYVEIHDYPSHGKGGYYRDLEIESSSFEDDKTLLIACLKNDNFLKEFNKQTNSEINVDMDTDIFKELKVDMDENNLEDATYISLIGIFNGKNFDICIFNGYDDCHITFNSSELSENITKYSI